MIGRTALDVSERTTLLIAFVFASMLGIPLPANAQDFWGGRRSLRDYAERQLLEAPGERELYLQLNSLNRELGEPRRSLEVFERLLAEHPEQAKNHWTSATQPGMATRVVIEHRRFDLLRRIEVDLVQEFEWEKRLYETSVRAAQRRGNADSAVRISNAMGQHLVEYSLLLIESALALGQEGNARTIQQRALAMMSDQRLRNAIP
jgi:hypothetical protein